jgi:hypothetical protein
MLEAARQFTAAMEEGKTLGIEIRDPTNRTTIGGTSGNVNARYPNR